MYHVSAKATEREANVPDRGHLVGGTYGLFSSQLSTAAYVPPPASLSVALALPAGIKILWIWAVDTCVQVQTRRSFTRTSRHGLSSTVLYNDEGRIQT